MIYFSVGVMLLSAIMSRLSRADMPQPRPGTIFFGAW